MISEMAQFPIINSGSQFLKEKYLMWMLKEPILASFAVTESEAGSDLANAKMRAERKGDYYILNGDKKWITNCGHASWYFVLARTSFNASQPISRSFTGFIVDRNSRGLSVGKKENNIGQRCSDTRSLFLTNVEVPVENVVGHFGDGFKLVMHAFTRVRPIIASMACGLVGRCLDESARYSTKRKTFGKLIIEHQEISSKIAEMATNLEAIRGLVEKSARKIDENANDASYYSSIAKVFASDCAFKAAYNTIQIFGANGLTTDYPVEKLLRDSKILQIYGGTSEIQRLIIAKLIAAKYS